MLIHCSDGVHSVNVHRHCSAAVLMGYTVLTHCADGVHSVSMMY